MALQVRDSDGSWVSMDEYKTPPRLRLLEAKNTVLGELYTSLKEELTNGDPKKALLLARELFSRGNQTLSTGIKALFKENSELVFDLVRANPSDYPELAPIVLKKVKDKEAIIDAISSSAPSTVIEACRILKSGEDRLLEFLGSEYEDEALYVLATFPSLKESTKERLKDNPSPFALAATYAPSDVDLRLKMSFLPSEVQFSNRIDSIDDIELAANTVTSCAVETLRQRNAPLSDLQLNFKRLLTVESAREFIQELLDKELKFLIENFKIEDIGRLLHDRIRVALIDDKDQFTNEYLKFLGKWCGTELPNMGGFEEPQDSISVIYALKPDETVLENELSAMEKGYPSIGLEFQNLGISPENHFRWKEFLVSHGIRSAARPEMGSMVEASLPPFFDISHLEYLLEFLNNSGFFKDSECAVHISIGVPAKEEFKYIALGLMCLYPTDFDPKNKDWVSSMTSIMSKGLVYNNPGSRPVHHSFSCPESHTEIRVFSIEGTPKFDFLRLAQFWARELLRETDKFKDLIKEIKLAEKEAGLNLTDHSWEYGTGEVEGTDNILKVPLMFSLIKYRELCIEHPEAARKFHDRIKNAFIWGQASQG